MRGGKGWKGEGWGEKDEEMRGGKRDGKVRGGERRMKR